MADSKMLVEWWQIEDDWLTTLIDWMPHLKLGGKTWLILGEFPTRLVHLPKMNADCSRNLSVLEQGSVWNVSIHSSSKPTKDAFFLSLRIRVRLNINLFVFRGNVALTLDRL